MVKIVELGIAGNPLVLSEGVLPRSDTIFGLLFINHLRKGYSTNGLFEKEFNLSSMFPLINIGDKKIFFLPRPFKYFSNENEENRRERSIKKISKARFISLNVLKNRIRNLDELELISNDFLITKEEKKLFKQYKDVKFFFKDEVNRVTVKDKVKKEDRTLPFSSEIIWPLKNERISVNAYFLVNGMDKQVEKSIFLMKTFGLGGKTSFGKNFINEVLIYDANKIFGNDLLMPNKNCFSISLFIPRKEDVNMVEFYLLIGRNSYLYNKSLKKKFVNKFVEGSRMNGLVKGFSNFGVEGVLKFTEPEEYFSYCKPFLLSLEETGDDS